MRFDNLGLKFLLAHCFWGRGVICIHNFPLRNSMGMMWTTRLIAIHSRGSLFCLFVPFVYIVSPPPSYPKTWGNYWVLEHSFCDMVLTSDST